MQDKSAVYFQIAPLSTTFVAWCDYRHSNPDMETDSSWASS